MPKYLSGRAKLTSRYTDDRRKYLHLNQAEPSLAIPLSPIGDETDMPTGDIMQIVSVYGDPNPTNRYWVPFGGGLIPGAVTVYEEGTIVGGPSSTTQLDIQGNIVTAIGDNTGLPDPGVAVTFKFAPIGNDHELMFNDNGDFGSTSNFVYDNSTVGVTSVGIGTTTPSTNLHIVGSARITETIYDYNNDPGSITNILTKGAFGIEWVDSSAVQSGAGGTFYEVQYHGTTGLVDGAPNFVWRGDRVGIGSTLPDRLLDVYGNTRFTGVSTFSQLNPDNLYAGITTFINNVKFDGATEGKDVLWDRNNSILEFQDDAILGIGDGTDLQLSHDGSVSKIDAGTTYPLHILGDEFVAKNAGASQTYIAGFHDQGVELFYGGDKKLETVNNGVKVHGTLVSDKFNAEEYEADDFVVNKLATITSLDSTYNVLGVTTAGVTSTTDLEAQTLEVTGTGTLEKVVVNNITIDGSTVESTSGNLILKVPAGSTIDIDSITTIDNIEDSDSAVSTGAFRVIGGASVNKKLYVGQNLTVSGVTTLASTGGTTTTGGDLYVNGDIHNEGKIYNDEVSGNRIEATEQLKTLHFHATGISTVGILTSTADVSIAGSLSVSGFSTFIGVSTFKDDVLFEGNTNTEYVSWDKSENQLFFTDNAKASFGDDGDLIIQHISDETQNNSEIKNITGWLNILAGGEGFSVLDGTATNNLIKADNDDAVTLYWAGTTAPGERFKTTESGIDVTGHTETDTIKVSGLSTFTGIGTFVSDLYVGGDLFLNQDIGADSGTYGTLRVTNSSKLEGSVQFGADGSVQFLWDKDDNELNLKDDIQLTFGDREGGDFQIYHDTSQTNAQSTISNVTGILNIQSGSDIDIKTNSKNSIYAEADGQVKLYYNDGEKLSTTGEGVYVGGGITANGGICIGIDSWKTGVTAGDIISDGGDNSFFGIYNKASHDYGRISLIPTGADGVSKSLLDVQIGTGITVHSNILPITSGDYTLGSPDKKWKNLYLETVTIEGEIANDRGSFEFLKVGTAATTQLLHATGITTLGAGATVTGISTFNSQVHVLSNVGIGTDNPGEKLDVVGKIRSTVNPAVYTANQYSATFTAREDEKHTFELTVNQNSSIASEVLGTYQTGGNHTTVINAENGWNVGIGTIGTTARLAIRKGSGTGLDLIPENDSDDFQINFVKETDTSDVRGHITYEFDNDSLKFRTGGSGDALEIDSGGDVLPGTTDGTQDLGSTNNRWGTIYGNNLDLSAGKVESSDVSVTWLNVTGIASITKTESDIYSGISSGRGEPSESDLELVNLHNATGSYNSLHFINGSNTDKQGDISFNSINTADFKSEFAIKQRFSKEGYYERLRINESGNIGIGTNDPNAKLELVAESGVDLRFYETTSNKSFSIGIDNNPNVFYIKDNITTDTPNRLVITSQGLIGIGLDNPTYRLYVEHDEDKLARFIRSDAGNALFYINSQDANNVILGLGKNSDPDIQYIESNNSDNKITFGTAAEQQLHIDSSGHVYPHDNKGQDLGQGSNRWKTIYAEKIDTVESVETNYVKIEYLFVDRDPNDNTNSGISTFEGNVNVGSSSTTAIFDVDAGKLRLRDGNITSTETGSIIEGATTVGGSLNLGRKDDAIVKDVLLGSVEFHGTPISGSWAKSSGMFAKAANNWDIGDYSSYLQFYTTEKDSITQEPRLTIAADGSVKLSKNDSSLITNNDVRSQAPLYIEVESDINAVGDRMGDSTTGLVRISDTGTNDQYFHGIELRNKNDGEVRLLNLSSTSTDESEFVIATDGGTGIGIKERVRVSYDGNVSIGFEGNASDNNALTSNDAILSVGEIRTNKVVLSDSGSTVTSESSEIQYLDVTGITTTKDLNVTGFSTFRDDVHLFDNKKLRFGGSEAVVDGLDIYHQSSDNNNYIESTQDSTSLFIRSDTIELRTAITYTEDPITGALIPDDATNKNMITATSSGIILYSQSSKVLETSEDLVTITGNLDLTGSSSDNGNIISEGGDNGNFGLYNSKQHTGSISFNIKNNNENYKEALKIHLWNADGQNVKNDEDKSWFDFRGHLRPTDDGYDIGSSEAYWNKLWVKSITVEADITGSITNADDATNAITATNAKNVATAQVDSTLTAAHYLTFVNSDNPLPNTDDDNQVYERLRTDAFLYVNPKDDKLNIDGILKVQKIEDTDGVNGIDDNISGRVLTVTEGGDIKWLTVDQGSDTTYKLQHNTVGSNNPGEGSSEIQLRTEVGNADSGNVMIQAGNNIKITGSDGGFEISAVVPDAPDIPALRSYNMNFDGVNGTSGTGKAVWQFKQTEGEGGSKNLNSVTLTAGPGITISNSVDASSSGSSSSNAGKFTISASSDISDQISDISFLDLTDTPSSWSGSRKKFLAVEDHWSENKIVFVDDPSEGASDMVKTYDWNSNSNGDWVYLTMCENYGSTSGKTQKLYIANDTGRPEYDEKNRILRCATHSSWNLRMRSSLSSRNNNNGYGKVGQIISAEGGGGTGSSQNWEWITPPWVDNKWSEFKKDTHLVFVQNWTPTGWTRKTDATYRGAALALFGSSVITAGGTETTFGSGGRLSSTNKYTEYHSMSAGQESSHTHTAGYPAQGSGDIGGQGWPSNRSPLSNRYQTFRTSNRGPLANNPDMNDGVRESNGGLGHRHGLHFDCKYVGGIVCKKDSYSNSAHD